MLFDFGDGNGYVASRRHENGGGIVSTSAHVDPTVFLSSESCVFGHAKILGNVRVTGRSRISGRLYPGGMSTLIEDDVLISGNTLIEGCVLLRNQAQIRDNAQLIGGIQVAHHAIVSGNAKLMGDVLVLDHALITDDVQVDGREKQIVVKNVDALRGTLLITTNEQVRALEFDKPRKRTRSKTDLEIRDNRILGT